MKKLFEPVVVGGLALRNRLIRSATFEYAFDEASGHIRFQAAAHV